MSEATTVAEAMRALAAPPRWILLDLMLPDGNGVSVIRKVKREKLSSRVCVITGCSSELMNEARRAGAEHSFVKPVDVSRLMAVLGE